MTAVYPHMKPQDKQNINFKKMTSLSGMFLGILEL